MRARHGPALACTRDRMGREERGARRPVVQGERSDNPGRGRILARVAGVGALLVGVVLVALVLFGGDDGHKYKLLFETGGQLVPGNQVLVGGQPIGTVDDIKLTEDAQAEVEITVDEPLHEGTTAIDPRDLALGDRQPLRLDRAGPQLASPRSPTARRSPRTRRPRRSTSTSSSTPSTPRRASGLPGLHPGPGRRSTPATARPRERDLQVLRARPAVDRRACSPS